LEHKVRKVPPQKIDQPEALNDFNAEKCQIYQDYISNSGVYRVLSGGGEPILLNEFRTITTIFIKIKKITFKTDSCLQHSQEAMDALQKALYKYEGTLRQFIVDDKGSVILSYFGLPPFAHENDPMIALKACLEVRNRMRPIFSDGFSIGVATGVVYVGMVGNSQRADYTVTGDSVNMAARLMSNALSKGDVVCDEETYEASKDVLDFEPLGKIKVKGKVDPIAVYRPKRSKDCSNAQMVAFDEKFNAIIKREKEKSILTETLNDFVAAKKRLVCIEGDANQGAKPLINHAKSECGPRHLVVLHSVASETETNTPFWCFKSVIQDLTCHIQKVNVPENLAVNPAAQGSSRRGSVTLLGNGARRMSKVSVLEPGVEHSQFNLNKQRRSSTVEPNQYKDFESKVLGGLQAMGLNPNLGKIYDNFLKPTISTLSVDEVSNTPNVELTYSQKAQKFVEVTIQLMNTASKDGTKFVILAEEYHWADYLSWELLENIAHYCPNVYFVLNARNPKDFVDHRSGLVCERMRNLQESKIVALENLTKEELHNFISLSFGSDVIVSEKVLNAIYKRTGGNLVFAQTLLGTLMNGNKLTIQDGELTHVESELNLAESLPKDIKKTVSSQMDKLNQTFQIVLRVGAILGIQFSLENAIVYGDLKNQDVDTLILNIPKWDVFGYLEEGEVTSEAHLYTFKSSLIRECIVSMMLYKQREVIHVRLANHYERILTQENAEEVLPKIYEHYKKADNHKEQLRVLSNICQLYTVLGYYEEAVEYYQQLIKLGNSKVFRQGEITVLLKCKWLRELAEIHLALGNNDAALKGFQAALGKISVKLDLDKHISPKSFFASCCGKGKDNNPEVTKPEFNLEHSLVIKGLFTLFILENNTDKLRTLVNHALEIGSTSPKMDSLMAYVALMIESKDISKKALQKAISSLSGSFNVDASNVDVVEMVFLCYFVEGSYSQFSKYGESLSSYMWKSEMYSKWSNTVLLTAFSMLLMGNLSGCAQIANDMIQKASVVVDPGMERWGKLLLCQERAIKGDFDECKKTLASVQASYSAVNAETAGDCEKALFESLNLFVQVQMDAAKVEPALVNKISEKLANLENRNILNALSVFYYARSLLTLHQAKSTLVEKSNVGDAIEQLNKVIVAQKMYAYSTPIKALCNSVQALSLGNAQDAADTLRKNVGLFTETNKLSYVDGLFLSLSLSFGVTPKARKESGLNPFEEARRLLQACEATQDLKELENRK
jgi:predicted ATPase